MRSRLTLAVVALCVAALTGCSAATGADGTSDEPDGGLSVSGPVTAAQVCDAIDLEIVAAEIAPVREVQHPGELYCNLYLDLPGLGNSLNVSVPPPAGQGPEQTFEGTVNMREMTYGGTASPVVGLGTRAAAMDTDMGVVLVVLLGETVVMFDPMLAEGVITLENWKRILEPAFAKL